jgi:hypothetical protein
MPRQCIPPKYCTIRNVQYIYTKITPIYAWWLLVPEGLIRGRYDEAGRCLGDAGSIEMSIIQYWIGRTSARVQVS